MQVNQKMASGTNRIDTTFARLRERGEAAFVPFLTLGDPSLEATRRLLRVVDQAGADLIELGVPFSDPTADGPVLQRSLEHGLARGATLRAAFEIVADFRKESETPIVLYGYYNPIFRYGLDAFARDAAASGVDGILVVDLPPEEADELLQHTDPAGIRFVCLLAPTSGPERIRTVLARAAGFVYYVSVTGVTGGKPIQPAEVRPVVQRLRERTDLPVGVGFGIATTEQAAAVAEFADAVVVGSALMRLVSEHRDSGDLEAVVGEFVRSLKSAVAGASRAPWTRRAQG